MNRGYSACRWINSSGFWDLHVFITYNNVQLLDFERCWWFINYKVQCTIVVYQ
jgi:hypothetical protein